MPWYAFALLVPILYSISNYIDKYLIEKRIPDPFAITALTSVFSGVLGIIFGIAMGWKTIGGGVWIAIAAGVLLVLYLVPYFAALKRDDASRVAPLFGFIPVFTLLLSSVILNESLASKQIIGMLIVIAGGLLLSVRRFEGNMFAPRASLWFMLLSSLMYGAVSILFRFVARDAGYWSVLSWEYIGKGIAGAALLMIPAIRTSIRKQFTSIKQSIGLIAITDGLGIVAQMSEAYAVTIAIVPLVNIIGGVQPFFTLTEGLLLTLLFPKIIKEDIRRNTLLQKFISVAFIFTGLYLVYA